MKDTLDTDIMSDVAFLCGNVAHVTAVFEHRAFHVSKDLSTAADHFSKTGFQVRLRTANGCIFLENEDQRIELIPPEIPSHLAWAVQTREEFLRLNEALTKSQLYVPVGEVIDTPALSVVMYQYLGAGVLQFIRRESQIFDCIFPRKKT